MPRLVRVAAVGEIAVGSGKTVEVGDLLLAVYNAGDGRYYASSAICPHEYGPLGDGVLDGASIVCPMHGFDFDLRTGACRVDPLLSVEVYPVRVQGQDLLVELP